MRSTSRTPTLRHGEPGLGNGISDAAHVVDDEGRVRLGRRPKVGVDTEVDLQISVLERAAAASCEVIGLRNSSDAEYSLVEGDRLRLAPGGHGQLHMVETNNSHGQHSASAPRAPPIAGSASRAACHVVLASMVACQCRRLLGTDRPWCAPT